MVEDLNNVESNNSSLFNFGLFGNMNSFDGGVITSDIYPSQNNTINIGKSDAKFASIFSTNGEFTSVSGGNAVFTSARINDGEFTSITGNSADFTSVFCNNENTKNLNLISDNGNETICALTTDTNGDLVTSATNLKLNNGNAIISSIDSAINLPAGSSIGNIPWGLVQINGVLNSPSDLPENSSVGSSFLIDRNLWICYEAGPPSLFQNAGNFTGPQGARGVRGERGPPGPGFDSIEYNPNPDKKYSLFFDPESKKITYG